MRNLELQAVLGWKINWVGAWLDQESMVFMPIRSSRVTMRPAAPERLATAGAPDELIHFLHQRQICQMDVQNMP